MSRREDQRGETDRDRPFDRCSPTPAEAPPAWLEFHHVEPCAAGGTATVANVQLRCRAHNGYEAQLFFGEGSRGNHGYRGARTRSGTSSNGLLHSMRRGHLPTL